MTGSVQILAPSWSPIPKVSAQDRRGAVLVVSSAASPLDAEGLVLDLASQDTPRIAVIGPAGPVHEALRAFAASVAAERRGGSALSVALDPADPDAVALANELAHDPDLTGELRLAQGQLWRREWRPVTAPRRALAQPRVVLVTGGLGGVGRLVAEHLARGGARVTLVGRSPLSAEARSWLGRVPNTSYVVADVCSPEGAEAAVAAAGDGLDLVLHAAGVKADGPVVHAKLEDLKACLGVKIRGAWNLWRATEAQGSRLVLFGSLAAVSGNPGQAAYAAGNAWMEGFAASLGGSRVQTVAWTYWEDGGMALSEAGRAAMARAGLRGLSAAEGLGALEDTMALEQPRLSVVVRQDQAPERPAARREAKDLEPALTEALVSVLKLGDRRVDPEAELSDYGLDSIGLTQLAAAIGERLPGVTIGASIFVEHSTIRALARHLAGAEVSAPAPAPTPTPTPAPTPPTTSLGAALRGWLAELPSAPTPSPIQAPAPSPVTPKSTPSASAPIAIIGYAARLPGPPSLAALHAALCAGDNWITRAPADRWDWRAFEGDPAEGDNHTDCHLAGFLPEIRGFDAEHFHISPREAALMDPQQRLLLTLVWEALERAGYDPLSLKGARVASFVGAGRNEYGALLASRRAMEAHTNTGNTPALLSNRLAWFYGWTGPSQTLDAGCAGSMVAVAEAVATLRRGDAAVALAGGVSLILAPHGMVTNRRMGLLTASGEVRSYDAEADGHVFGEGAGLVVLKPLDRALADGDTVFGVIRGVSVNHSGRTPTLTTPSALGQAQAMRDALAEAGLGPDDLSGILGQGTATAASDAAELGAYRLALTGRAQPAPLSSLDGALGHLESASGVAALIVGLEVLRTGALPPVVHFGAVSPQTRQEGPLPVQVSSAVTRLTDGPGPTRLGVHNFGYGGVNAHLVLEAPPIQPTTPTPGPALLVLSAPRASQLQALATALGEALSAQPSLDLHDVAFTLRAGRRAFEHRLALVVHDLAEAAARLLTHNAETPAGELGRVEAPTGQLAVGDLHALARAFCRGDSLPTPAPARRVPLPTLPLYGPGSGAGSHWAAASPAGPGTPRPDDQGWSMDRRFTSVDPLMRDHRVRGLPTLPAAGALAALSALTHAAGLRLAVQEAVWLTPLSAPDGERVAARLSLRGDGSGAEAELRGADGALHFQAHLGPMVAETAGAHWPSPSVDARRVSGEALRQAMAEAGLTLGEALSAVEDVVVSGELAFGQLRAPEGATGLDLETALLDGAFQVASALLSAPSLPVSVSHLWRQADLSGATSARARRLADAGRLSRVALELVDSQGQALMTLGQLGLLPVNAETAGLAHARVEPTAVTQAPAPRPSSTPSADALVAELRALLAAVLGADPASLHPDRPLSHYGLDSVLAVEAAQALSARFGPLPATYLFEFETINAIARDRAGAVPVAPTPPAAPAAPAASPARSASPVDPEAVAIIGMAGRYPQAPDLAALWALLAEDRQAITAPPADRWDPLELERIDPGGRTRRGGFLDGVERFDHALFEIPQATAATMDPQVRLVLEVAWETLLAAGYPPERLAEAQGDAGVGVFVASMAAPYPAVADDPQVAAWLGHVTGWPLANRVSHTLDLRGPSVAVDAACAGGLAAVHLAAEAVRRGEASMALAAGVNLILHPSKLASLGQSGLGGSGEESQSLQGGDGYLPAEGCGAVLLRRLSDAIAAGDRVLGVIRASGISHNGRSAGLHTPSANAQARLIRAVRARAGDAGDRVSAIECGATGARLGDAVESAALKSAYADRPTGSVAVSTVKANLGHAEGASGLAQLHRALLQLTRRQLLPTRGAATLDPGLGWAGSALAPVVALRPWGVDEHEPLVIAVNAAGAGGANAHLLVQSAPPTPRRPASAAAQRLFVLSARTPKALTETAARLAQLCRQTSPNLDDLSYTLLIAAPRQRHRLAVVAEDANILADRLHAWISAPEAQHPHLRVGSAGPGLAEALAGALGEAVAAALPSAADLRAAVLWVNGVELPWAKLTPAGARLTETPPYVFDRARCWLHDGPILCRSSAFEARLAEITPDPPSQGPPPPAPTRSPIRAALEDALVALVGPEAAADSARPLRQLGLDSLLSLQLTNRVERATGLRLDPEVLLNDPTLDRLTQHLEERLPSAAPRLTTSTDHDVLEPLPLSVNQRWHWSLHRLLPDQPGLLTIPVALRLTGPLLVERLHAALQATVNRHPALRRAFFEGDDGPLQRDVAQVELPLRVVDLRHLPLSEAQAAAQAALEADQAPFDLSAPPLLRATLAKLDDQTALLGLTAHHLAVDLWSVGLLIRELAERYTAAVEGRAPRLDPVEGGLRDLLAWEARTWTPETLATRAEALLDGLPRVLEPLALGGGEPAEPRAAVIRCALPTSALGAAVARGERTAFEQLFAALALRLAVQTEATDLLIGVPVLGRELPEADGALGFYADVVAVHVRVDPSHSRGRVAAEAIASLRSALMWRLPFPEALSALRGRQLDRSRPPVSVCVTFSARAGAPRMAGLDVAMADSGRADLVFDLFLTAIEGDGSLELVLEYQPGRVGHEGARRIIEDIPRVLGALSDEPDRPVSALLPALGLTRRPRVRVAGTFSLDGLHEAISLWAEPLQLDLRVDLAGYQQAFQELLMPDSGLARLEGGLGVVLVRMWDGRAAPRRLAEDLAAAVEAALPRLKSPLLIVRCPDPPTADASFDVDANAAWHTLQSRLGDRVGWLSPEAIFGALSPAELHDPVTDHEAHLPYSTDGVLALGAALVRRLASQVTPPYKVLAVDCDNTLWAGVIGEQGATGVVVDAPRARLQRLLVGAVEAGALVVLVTKNNEDDVREVLERHPAMVLRLPQVTRVAASWRPKSETLREVLTDLNLGLGDVLFLDDNPMEIAEVEAALPQVSAVRMPVEPEALDHLLDQLWPLDPRRGTAADAERTAQYRVVAERAAFQRSHSSYRDFLAALELSVSLTPITEADLARVSQLTLRTTQFNATHRRRSEADLGAWLGEPGRLGRVVRAKDRFGDYGLVGVLLAEERDGALNIDTLLMSCRVLGRGIEHQTLAEAGRVALARGLPTVTVRCVPTARNQPMRDFLEAVLGPYAHDEPGARVIVAESGVVAAIRAETGDAAPRPVEEAATAPPTGGRAASLKRVLALRDPAALRAALARRRPVDLTVRPVGTPPETETERRLAALWREVLQVAPSREDDFFVLGGDSLAATRLISRVAAQLWEGGLTLDGVFAAPTLAAMAARLDAALLSRVQEVASLDEEALNRAYEALIAGGDPQQPYEL